MIAIVFIIGGIAYAIVGIVVARVAAGHIAWHLADHYGQKRPDKSDWSNAHFEGGLAGALWPITAVCVALWFVATRVLARPVVRIWDWAGERFAVGAERRKR